VRLPPERLDSWKEIAGYLGRGVRTVVRWEQENGLPIHRVTLEKRSSVYAFRAELDEWLRTGGEKEEESAPPASGRKLSLTLAIAALAAVLAMVYALVPRHPATPAPVITPLTTYPGAEYTPSFSPDGNSIAFAWFHEGNQDIYTKGLHEETPTRLTTDPASDEKPIWSPDGGTIAFQREIAFGRRAVILIPARGGPERRIAELAGNLNRTLAWSPDSGWLLATHRDDGGSELLYWISVQTGEFRPFTKAVDSGQRDAYPALSLSGAAVAFVRSQSGGNPELCVVRGATPGAPGAEPACRPAPLGGDGLDQCAWMPGGGRLLYLGGEKLFIVPVPSGEVSPLNWAGDRIESFGYSAVAARLAFSSSTKDSNLWVRGVDGADAGAQLFPSTRWEAFGEYSAAGRQVAFFSDRSGAMQVWLGNTDGSNLRQLSHWRVSSVPNGRLSPDGRRVAVADLRGDGVHLIETATGLETRLAGTKDGDIRPAWSPDGNWIYFVSRRDGAPRIWKAPAAGGAAEPVTRAWAFGGSVSPDNRFLYFTRAAVAPALWRVPTAGGKEEEVFRSSIFHLNFAIAADRIYFTRREDKGAEPDYFMSLYDFRSARLGDLWRYSRPASFGLSLSPDGRKLLFAQIDEISADLWLAENVR
jgi:Tol biopolymer transport system component